ncbi:unnamed protein product [Adineta ricciae]|uniref:Uncharacterized protein n=1 Tax=Adineta ricciae TaxID=249248 RepID=A0A814VEG8_ADIRI|nr:unnamed protein product [Adineta ricciae]
MLPGRYIKIICAVAINLTLFSFLGIIALSILWHTKLTPFQDYSLVIDVGSRHTKIFVYTWPADKSDGLGTTSRVSQVKSCSVSHEPITSVIHPTENNVKNYFDTGMTECISTIPSTRKSRALIFLGATAGLRLFNITNPDYINRLLNATRAYFGTLGVLFDAPEFQVRIIDGSEEGLSAWISTNMLLKELYEHHQPMETYGVTDMGGASTQLSFIAPDATSEHYNLDLFGIDYDVYSHSYLCYGEEQARLVHQGQLVQEANESYSIDDPCLQYGYTEEKSYEDLFNTACARGKHAPSEGLNTGAGDYKSCRIAMEKRFSNLSCTSSSCSFDNIYQPIPIPFSMKIIAISSWYETFSALAANISIEADEHDNYNFTSVNLTDIKHVIKEICKQSWSHVHKPTKHRPFLCFNSIHQWTLFEFGFHMTDENLKNFQIVDKINSNNIGWTLGYMINQTNYLSPEHRPARLLTQQEFIILLVLSIILFLTGSITTTVIIYRYKQYYQQSKTISRKNEIFNEINIEN